MRCGSWDTEWDRQNSFPFSAIFCPFTPITTRKIKILKKWKNHLDTSTFHTCVKNHDHTMSICFLRYGVWQTQLLFWTIFCPFTPLTTKKIKILKKLKKTPTYTIILQKCTINDIIWCMVPEISSTTDIIFCRFGPVFALLPH